MPVPAIVTPDGTFTWRGETFRAALGRNSVRANKREGDGATPVGTLPLRQVLYRPDRGQPPVCTVPVRALTPADGWCDDPTLPEYNRQVQLPVEGSAEILWRNDTIYDIIGVLGWNDRPTRTGMGSAIFLHVARPDFAPTDGCVALAAADLRWVLATGLTELIVTE
jgi:L,D-peptidoglycan transpeptidase YkuD (ErfK/YbiS/YcfS/YnhG family)